MSKKRDSANGTAIRIKKEVVPPLSDSDLFVQAFEKVCKLNFNLMASLFYHYFCVLFLPLLHFLETANTNLQIFKDKKYDLGKFIKLKLLVVIINNRLYQL